MILSADITEKSFGSKILYNQISFEIHDGEKIGLIGRNGTGKSTLINILNGEDKDYQGEVIVRRGSVIISSRQEHHGHEDKTVLEYIQGDLPEYKKLTHIIDTYPETMGDNPRKIQEFSDALERFGELNYYQVEEDIGQLFESYQLDKSLMHRNLGSLSGGQKRMAELIKVQQSRGHLALIDEPTNHMDYVAKESFVKWLKSAQEAVLVITHDRDVLNNVDKIIEIRDGVSYTFKGNYKDYLRTNKTQVTSEVNQYDVTQRRIENLKQDVVRFRRLKEKSRNPGTIKRFKNQEIRAQKELDELQKTDKPSFWIDQESAQTLNTKMTEAYGKYKATNIKVRAKSKNTENNGRMIIQAHKLSLGYDDMPLFDSVTFNIAEGEKLHLHGRNGAGKTTIVQAIMSTSKSEPLKSTCFAGEIHLQKELKIGLYEQEISSKYLELTLYEAIESILYDKNMPSHDQKIKQLLSDYLFNPITDGAVPVNLLSGGQKARLQLISMLASDPQLLILDEPTNHLDLPSIEELENALADYHGAIIYISHDSFFAQKLQGTTVNIGK